MNHKEEVKLTRYFSKLCGMRDIILCMKSELGHWGDGTGKDKLVFDVDKAEISDVRVIKIGDWSPKYGIKRPDQKYIEKLTDSELEAMLDEGVEKFKAEKLKAQLKADAALQKKSKIGNMDVFKRVSDFFKRTLEKAGLKSSLIDEDGHRKVLTGFHITRLAFVTFASKYMSPFLVQKIVGHAHISMTAHYFQTQEDDMRKGLDQMPDFTGNNPPIVIKTEDEQIALLLDEVKREGESKLDCLKRLITSSVRVAG